jgi:hypothetical protein
MIDLSLTSEAYELKPPYGLRVTGMAAAQAAARRAVEAIERQARERTEAGLALDGLPDLSAEGDRDGFYQTQLTGRLRSGTLRAGPASSWKDDRRRPRPKTSPR